MAWMTSDGIRLPCIFDLVSEEELESKYTIKIKRYNPTLDEIVKECDKIISSGYYDDKKNK